MPNCSFCDAKEETQTPLCQSCGAIRYPIASATPSETAAVAKQKKLKLSATLAVAIFTPGSLLVLTLVCFNKLNKKLKIGKKRT